MDEEEKGRCVYAGEDIDSGDYVAEYKYSLSYKRKEKKKKEDIYEKNGEGCYILETQLPKSQGWICLDATRNLNCWGRYINHSANPNLKICKPMMVRGKWRVGFTARQDIKKGEEVTYDYGKQKNPPYWMVRKKSLKVRVHTKTYYVCIVCTFVDCRQQPPIPLHWLLTRVKINTYVGAKYTYPPSIFLSSGSDAMFILTGKFS